MSYRYLQKYVIDRHIIFLPFCWFRLICRKDDKIIHLYSQHIRILLIIIEYNWSIFIGYAQIPENVFISKYPYQYRPSFTTIHLASKYWLLILYIFPSAHITQSFNIDTSVDFGPPWEARAWLIKRAYRHAWRVVALITHFASRAASRRDMKDCDVYIRIEHLISAMLHASARHEDIQTRLSLSQRIQPRHYISWCSRCTSLEDWSTDWIHRRYA